MYTTRDEKYDIHAYFFEQGSCQNKPERSQDGEILEQNDSVKSDLHWKLRFGQKASDLSAWLQVNKVGGIHKIISWVQLTGLSDNWKYYYYWLENDP